MKKIVLVLLMVSGFLSAECVRLESGRSYRLHVPPAYSGLPIRTLMVLHGTTGSAAAMEKYTLFNQIGDSMDWVIAYPDGIDGKWHSLLPVESDADDMGYLSAVVDDLRTRIDIDGLFVTGFSAGAVMSYQFAASQPEIVSGVASVAGCIGGGPEGDDPRVIEPLSEIPVLIIHGLLDETIPYHGGWFARRREWICLSVSDALDLFMCINHCAGSPNERVEEGPWGKVIIDHFYGKPGKSVEVHTYCDMAHRWPRDAEKKILLFFSQQLAAHSIADPGTLEPQTR